ncbi:hypothetical protein K493DRAFT_300374 [Basidiobolus meristosporus CBS 931.73]|uniref:VPS9 domain-containing protein n=1 Tax=Basidiobolus meristosporus CBS 931.73 TaxID=1314790 RepID=A0A1Y1YHY7_9FUNG|nr:hypothetical protein K493DRAFT_300374 [Basidiobolus meristosporus CBS 931.73]|eukprot:ORX97589.1 hypothetical protein K493DRAFT_300374 [Basidiobolus meristosporus CBS 931.73]
MPLKNSATVSVSHPLDFGVEVNPEKPTEPEKDSVDSTHSTDPPSPTALTKPDITITADNKQTVPESTAEAEAETTSIKTTDSNRSLLNLVEKAQNFTITTNSVPISKIFLETPLSSLLSSQSVGQAILETLTDNPSEYEDIIERLVNKKAVILLPELPSMNWSGASNLNRRIIEDHVIVVQKWQRDSPITTLSGLKGYVQKEKGFLLDLNLPDVEEELSSDSSDTRRSIFGIFSKPKRMNKCINVQVRYANMYVPWNDTFVVVSVIENPISPEFQHILPDPPAAHPEDEKPMVWDILTKEINRFIQKMQLRSNMSVQESVESFRRFIERTSNTIENDNFSEEDADLMLEWVERLLALELYHILFSPVSADDQLKDQMLSSRIAALNIADLKLDHLGVYAQGEEYEHLMMMVEETGIELQKIDNIKAPADKIQILVNCHRIISASLDKYNKARASEGENPVPSSADTILPLLIYTVVKSNPPNYVSNLRFIQRYRNPLKATQEYSYCLTNMTYSDLTFRLGLILDGSDIFSGERGYGILGASIGGGIKAILSLPRNFGPLMVEKSEAVRGLEERRNSITGIKDGVEHSMKALSDVASNTGVVVGDGVRAITGVATSAVTGAVVGGSTRALSGMVNLMGRFLYKESAQKSAFSVTSSQPLDESIAAEMASRLEPVNLERTATGTNSTNSKISSVVNVVEPPIKKFMECSADELRIGEIQELLEDYKRMGALINELIDLQK